MRFCASMSCCGLISQPSDRCAPSMRCVQSATALSPSVAIEARIALTHCAGVVDLPNIASMRDCTCGGTDASCMQLRLRKVRRASSGETIFAQAMVWSEGVEPGGSVARWLSDSAQGAEHQPDRQMFGGAWLAIGHGLAAIFGAFRMIALSCCREGGVIAR